MKHASPSHLAGERHEPRQHDPLGRWEVDYVDYLYGNVDALGYNANSEGGCP
jgi:hypothetical protein